MQPKPGQNVAAGQEPRLPGLLPDEMAFTPDDRKLAVKLYVTSRRGNALSHEVCADILEQPPDDNDGAAEVGQQDRDG